MKNNLIKKLPFLVVISIFLFVLLLESNNDAVASSGVCDSAAEYGVCVGSGAKCNIKKGILTFRCGKDPDGDAIIINME